VLKIKGQKKEIRFPFDLEKDTPEKIAEEMHTDLQLPQSCLKEIQEQIREGILQHRVWLQSQTSAETSHVYHG
jgi:hypothetical protein